jgi:hypothetical protein
MARLDGRPLYPSRISDTHGYDLSQGDRDVAYKTPPKIAARVPAIFSSVLPPVQAVLPAAKGPP